LRSSSTAPLSVSAPRPPACATATTVVWIDTAGDAAAGSVYFHLKFTNLAARTCSLVGFPGVSAVDLAGHQLGSAASRSAAGSGVVDVVPGGSASAVLRIAQAANFPRAVCRPTTAAGLRVYPPDATASKVVPLPFSACSRPGPTYLTVGAVSPH
jgi:hypothetical protein